MRWLVSSRADEEVLPLADLYVFQMLPAEMPAPEQPLLELAA